MRDALYIIAVLTAGLLYLAPAIIAQWRRHYYRWPITAITFFLGATVIAWVICLIWAIWPVDASRALSNRS